MKWAAFIMGIVLFAVLYHLLWLKPFKGVIWSHDWPGLLLYVGAAYFNFSMFLWWVGGGRRRAIGRKLAAQDRALIEGRMDIRLDDER
jgi:hypothetical protein